MNVVISLFVALVVALALWAFDHQGQSLAFVESDRKTLADQNAALVLHSNALASALSDQTALRAVLNTISEQTRKTQTTLDSQSAQLNRDLVELRRNDEKTNAYLSSLVPVAVGLRYARPDTTDPVAYRAGAIDLRANPVPSTGSARAVGK